MSEHPGTDRQRFTQLVNLKIWNEHEKLPQIRKNPVRGSWWGKQIFAV
jgi:hypothetical protein